jgi:hypothetical protein
MDANGSLSKTLRLPQNFAQILADLGRFPNLLVKILVKNQARHI